eukprot:CAMPEP_0175075828 /NCGR_PEP_ID=MMETSP0052_2-20121109/22301_1 /TAXON_ID=51329 ORGANISM="Polytomella parva, Strain SAG 63-3" /NCGR_SAMPLE_ID=MMETSP0052_2 /ASSEMBLY_ACC=CAM_ASM_000194 /LENGTH=134 /DNA_ID=CAMNT_0016344725 /DNA_START=248 /DNA_END=649 /DNA_ORIENTATION=+
MPQSKVEFVLGEDDDSYAPYASPSQGLIWNSASPLYAPPSVSPNVAVSHFSYHDDDEDFGVVDASILSKDPNEFHLTPSGGGTDGGNVGTSVVITPVGTILKVKSVSRGMTSSRYGNSKTLSPDGKDLSSVAKA